MTNSRTHANRYWGERALPKSKAEFFNAVTTPAPAGDGTVATIRMYGPIDSWGGYWGISTKDVGTVLDALPDTVTQIILRINSPGGEVFEGVAILNMLRAHRASVTAVVDGLAASAASVIAAGCDETVMSPGTQMMIHSPWTITWGNATELRKDADRLDGIEASIIEIYVEKAGEKDWAALLAEETWMTAAETVESGLADRVATIPDAGETDTVGDDPELVILEPVADPDDEDATTIRIVARKRATRLPVSAEPGSTIRKENVVAYDDLKAGFAQRLGMSTDADELTDETLLAALDQALDEQADPTTETNLPAGVVAIDATVLANLQAQAAQGAQARAEQERARRDSILDTAMREGRISAASRDAWASMLEADEDRAVAALNTLAKNTIPVTEIGKSDEIGDADAALYEAAFGSTEGGK